MSKKVVFLSFIVIVGIFAFFFAFVPKVYAGAPFPPTLVSPADGSTVSSTPSLCATYSDPEGHSGRIRFETWGGGEGDHDSPWISANNGETKCWTDGGNWSPGTHQWQARAEDDQGQSGASSVWNVNIQSPPPPQENQPAPASCDIGTMNVSPSPPQAIGTNVSIYFQVNCTNGVSNARMTVDGSQIGSINSNEGTFSWDTNGWSASDHVIVIEVADNQAGYIKTRSQTYLLTNGAPPQGPEVTCSISSFDISPSSPQAAGTTVNISGSGDCNTGVRAMRIKIDGGIVTEIGAPSINWSWNTGGLTGNHTIVIEIAGNHDNDWSRRSERSVNFSFDLSSPSGSTTTNGVTFNNGDVIQIGNDIFVIISGMRSLVPNPATLDALGITRDWINNKGLSSEQLQNIPRGPDIPDVTVDRAGFDSFKSVYFNWTTSIVPGVPSQNNPQQPATTQNDTCPGSPTNLSTGMIALVSTDGNLNVRSNPGLSSVVNFSFPNGTQVSIISGPTCKDGHRWWEIGTNGQQGWSSEIGLIPNTGASNSPQATTAPVSSLNNEQNQVQLTPLPNVQSLENSQEQSPVGTLNENTDQLPAITLDDAVVLLEGFEMVLNTPGYQSVSGSEVGDVGFGLLTNAALAGIRVHEGVENQDSLETAKAVYDFSAAALIGAALLASNGFAVGAISLLALKVSAVTGVSMLTIRALFWK